MHWNSFLKGCGWLLAVIFLIASPTYAGGIPMPPVAPSSMDQGFALELFKTLCRLQPKVNILTSPLSVYSALMMTASGARGATLRAMANVLQVAPAQRALSENQICAYLAQADQGGGSATLHIANSIWTGRSIPLENAYVTRMTEQFHATVQPLPKNKASVMINSWVSDQTHGKIDRIVEQIDPNLALLIINAAYFKDAWQTPFQVKATTEGSFYLDDGGTLTVAYMARRGQFDYLAGDGLLAIRIPYQDPRFCMLVLLPPSKTPLDAFIESLSPVRMNWLAPTDDPHRGAGGAAALSDEHRLQLTPAIGQDGHGSGPLTQNRQISAVLLPRVPLPYPMSITAAYSRWMKQVARQPLLPQWKCSGLHYPLPRPSNSSPIDRFSVFLKINPPAESSLWLPSIGWSHPDGRIGCTCFNIRR